MTPSTPQQSAAEQGLSILSQLLRSEQPRGAVEEKFMLSILSQLLRGVRETMGETVAAAPPSAFQFFPSCCFLSL
jgi:hypothetical protein